MVDRFVLLSAIINICCVFGDITTLGDLSNDSETLQANQSLSGTEKEKLIARYGFQRTQECQNFEKAFTCVRKCMDFGYDVAVADKQCNCRCFQKKGKEKYKSTEPNRPTKWRFGAPTTSKPHWAQKMPFESNQTILHFNPDGQAVQNAELNKTQHDNTYTTTIESNYGDNKTDNVTGMDNNTDPSTTDPSIKIREVTKDSDDDPKGEHASKGEHDDDSHDKPEGGHVEGEHGKDNEDNPKGELADGKHDNPKGEHAEGEHSDDNHNNPKGEHAEDEHANGNHDNPNGEHAEDEHASDKNDYPKGEHADGKHDNPKGENVEGEHANENHVKPESEHSDYDYDNTAVGV